MRFLFRWAFRLFLIVIVLVVALVLLKDALIKSALESRIQLDTGMGARIGKFELGLLTPTITVQDCILYNPAEFGGSPFIELPELHIEYDRKALAFSDIHLKLVRLNLRQFNIVENMNGQTNLVAILAAMQKASEAKSGSGRTNIVPPNFKGIDTLNLTVGSVNYANLRYPERNRQVPVGLTNEILTNVRGPDDLWPLIVRTLFRTGITLFSQPPTPVPPPRPTPAPSPNQRLTSPTPPKR